MTSATLFIWIQLAVSAEIDHVHSNYAGYLLRRQSNQGN